MRIYDFILTIIASFILVALVMNASIYSYVEQKYHIELFDTNDGFLELIGRPKIWLDNARNALLPSVEDLALLQSLEEAKEKGSKEKSSELSQDDSQKSLWQRLMGIDNAEDLQEKEVRYPIISDEGNLVLKQDSTFIFIGDSMMQGVGMTLASELKKRGFSVINIAKQSTGLTYTHFFDWGKALSEAFVKNPHINVVVMMVGANDPYAMPKMKYGSEEWVETYSSRIKQIIDTSLENGAVVVWYSAPFVRKEPLNSRLIFLNSLYGEQIKKASQLLLDANSALAPDGIYTSYIKNDKGKSIRVRGEDGIHFSGDGSRALSKLLLDRLEIIDKEHNELENPAIAKPQSKKTTTTPRNITQNQTANELENLSQNPLQNQPQNLPQSNPQSLQQDLQKTTLPTLPNPQNLQSNQSLQNPPKQPKPTQNPLPNPPQNPPQNLPQNPIDFDTNTAKQESHTKPSTQTKQTKDGIANDEAESLEHTLQRVKNREKNRANNQNPPKKPKALDKQNFNESNEVDLANKASEASEANKDSTPIKDKKQKKDKTQKRKWNELFEDTSKKNPQEHKNEQNPHKEQHQKDTTKPTNSTTPQNTQPKQKLESSDITKRGA
ncbi:SGNH/GDSL hydrolase family protein [Helicobacter sp. T3_23-1056]